MNDSSSCGPSDACLISADTEGPVKLQIGASGNIADQIKENGLTLADRLASIHLTSDKPNAGGLYQPVKSFMRGAVYGAIQEPMDGTSQMFNHFGARLKVPKIVDAPQNGSKYAAAGYFVGSTIDFWLANLAVGKLTGIGRLTAASSTSLETFKLALTGAVVEAAKPVNPDTNFGVNKAAAVAESSAALATFGLFNGTANIVGFFGRAGFRSYFGESIVSGLSGATSGIVRSEVHSALTSHKPASLDDVTKNAGKNMVFGFAMSALEHTIPVSRTKAKPIFEGFAPVSASTEKWVGKDCADKTEQRAPMLTVIAEKSRNLRPPKYAELRAKALIDENSIDLRLGESIPDHRMAPNKEVISLSDNRDTHSGMQQHLAYFTDQHGIKFDQQGNLTSGLSSDQIQKLSNWRKETMVSSIEMHSKELFYQKTLLAHALMPQLNKAGKINYLFGKGIGVEISVQGDVIGRPKLQSEVPYRPHSDFELYAMAGEYSPEFKGVFGAQEFFPSTNTKGLRDLPAGLLHDTCEVVELAGVHLRVPQLELQFVDKMEKHNGDVERLLRGSTDHEILAKTYKLDRKVVHEIIEKYVIEPETKSWKPLGEQTRDITNFIARQMRGVEVRINEGVDRHRAATGHDALNDFIFNQNMKKSGINDVGKLFGADGGMVKNLSDVVQKMLRQSRAKKMAELQAKHALADEILSSLN